MRGWGRRSNGRAHWVSAGGPFSWDTLQLVSERSSPCLSHRVGQRHAINKWPKSRASFARLGKLKPNTAYFSAPGICIRGAADARVRLHTPLPGFRQGTRLILRPESGKWASRADQGVRPTINAILKWQAHIRSTDFGYTGASFLP